MLVAQGKLPEALDAYQQSLRIFQRLADQDKFNSGWQRDLIVALYKVATTVSKIGGNDNVTEGEELLRRALDIVANYLGTDQEQLIILLMRGARQRSKARSKTSSK